MRLPTSTTVTLVLAAFAAASLFLLLTEHRAHLLGLWLLLLIPVCLVLLYLAGSQAESELDPPGAADRTTPSDRKENVR